MEVNPVICCFLAKTSPIAEWRLWFTIKLNLGDVYSIIRHYNHCSIDVLPLANGKTRVLIKTVEKFATWKCPFHFIILILGLSIFFYLLSPRAEVARLNCRKNYQPLSQHALSKFLAIAQRSLVRKFNYYQETPVPLLTESSHGTASSL